MEAFSKLTIFFEAPFWIGVYERASGSIYEACKITFGAEPKDYEVQEFVLKNWSKLRFHAQADTLPGQPCAHNPKRIQREIKKQLNTAGAGTKAQQALKAQQEEGKLARKVRSRAQREAKAERQFALRQAKRKEKHRGH